MGNSSAGERDVGYWIFDVGLSRREQDLVFCSGDFQSPIWSHVACRRLKVTATLSFVGDGPIFVWPQRPTSNI